MSPEEALPQDSMSFEDFGHDNGIRFWYASWFCQVLGYANMKSFEKVIQRAIKACINAGIPYEEDFRKETLLVDGKSVYDYKLSRMACYLVAMNADSKKEGVAKAQVYFAEQVEQINLMLEGQKDLERLEVREELKESFKALQDAAKGHGVFDYALFNDAGFRAMYNKGPKQIAEIRGVKHGQLYDHMSRVELAANLFRMTLTEEKLKNLPGRAGQHGAERVHGSIGKQVRGMVRDNTGMNPENLPQERKLPEVKKELKKAQKKLKEVDKKKKK